MKTSLFYRTVAEWRGYKEPRPLDRYVKAEDIIKKILPPLGLRERFDEAEVKRAWMEIVGEFLSMHSEPIRLTEGILHIRVLQPSVRYELERHWKTDIIKKLKNRFGSRSIHGVLFCL